MSDRNSDDKTVRIMEVCGTHTAAIYRSGLRSLLPSGVHLVSGPGCPVCVTPPSFIDRCVEIAEDKASELLCFGDMLKVPGGAGRPTLSEVGASGGNVRMIYSPFEAIRAAQDFPGKLIAVAAVGFETTIPAYALLLDEAERKGLKNIRLVTALKSALAAIEWICASGEDVDAFICPGHVSSITGSQAYEPIAAKYKKPFVIAGFEDRHVAAAVRAILGRLGVEWSPPAVGQESNDESGVISASPAGREGESRAVSADGVQPTNAKRVQNLYGEAVRHEGNARAKAIVDKYFERSETLWRGLGVVPASGYFLREEYAARDISWGERDTKTIETSDLPEGCSCGDVILGRLAPRECALFGGGCTPLRPVGPCMVSSEGACGIAFRNL